MQNKNILVLDVETTGLIKYLHAIHTLAYTIQAPNGDILAKGSFNINPRSYMPKCKLDAKALEVGNVTEEEILSYPDAKIEVQKFIATLNTHFNGTQYQPVAYNADFDSGFISTLFEKVSPGTYWKLIGYKYLDPFATVKMMGYTGELVLPNQQLKTVAKHYGFEHIPHNALSDVDVTLQLFNKFMSNQPTYCRCDSDGLDDWLRANNIEHCYTDSYLYIDKLGGYVETFNTLEYLIYIPQFKALTKGVLHA